MVIFTVENACVCATTLNRELPMPANNEDLRFSPCPCNDDQFLYSPDNSAQNARCCVLKDAIIVNFKYFCIN